MITENAYSAFIRALFLLNPSPPINIIIMHPALSFLMWISCHKKDTTMSITSVIAYPIKLLVASSADLE